MSRRHHKSDDQSEAPQKSPVESYLARWASQPVRVVNARAIVWTGLTMMLLVFLSQRDPGQVAFIRNVAMVLIGVNGALRPRRFAPTLLHAESVIWISPSPGPR